LVSENKIRESKKRNGLRVKYALRGRHTAKLAVPPSFLVYKKMAKRLVGISI
jgi:hypothetical protein